MNEVIQEICQLIGTTKAKKTPYNTQCNGIVEKYNNTILDKLIRLVNGKFDHWYEILDLALFGCRISLNSRLKPSPFEILYGSRPILTQIL